MSSFPHIIPGWRRLAFAVLAALLCAWPARAPAQFPGFGSAGDRDPARNITATARILPATTAQPPRLSITAAMVDGWHVYSLTQQAGGPKRTRIELGESNDYKLAGPMQASPAPTVRHYNDIWPDLPVEEHEHQVTWTAPLALAAGVDPARLVIHVRLSVQLCRDRCVDVVLPLEARLEKTTAAVIGPPGFPADQPAAAVPQGTLSAAARDNGPAPSAAKPLLKFDFLALSGSLDHDAVAPGGRANLTLSIAPAQGWHVYALAEREPKDPLESRPTLIVVSDHGGLKIGPPMADSPPTVKKRAGDESRVDRLYSAPVHWTLPIEVPANTPPGNHTISGLIGMMVCSDVPPARCDTPKGAFFTATLRVENENRPGAVPVLFTATSYKQVTQAASRGPDWDQVAGVMPMAAPVKAILLIDVIFNLALAFLGGLILNAMPCVLPVIGLKVMSFVQQAGQDRRRVLVLNLWFTAGIVAVFLILAGLVAFAQLGGSAQFQRPQFGITLAAITFVFALSLLGVWEIPVPGLIGSHAAHEVGEREGASGAFAKGVLSTLLATPCVGPFMAGTLNWTISSGSTALTFAIYATMGLGMASPYLVIGARPELLRFLPKPGAWMETFKQLMGFVLLATVVWIFWFLPSRFFVPTLAMLFGLWMACWWIGRTPLTAELSAKLSAWAVAAIIATSLGVVSFNLLVGDATTGAAGSGSASAVWRPFTPQLFHELRAKRVTMLVDFTAKWCATCQANKKTALHTEATEKYMRENGIVGLVADKTEEAPDVDRLMVELGQTSKVIPFYAVYPGGGGPVITYNQGLLFQGTLLDMLKKAGRSPAVSTDAVAPAAGTSAVTAMKPH